MNGRTPSQAYEESMQADPHRIWNRPTAEDFRLLCLDQQIRTLDNKNASIQITIEGYGIMKYWSETLANLPISARSKKYIIFNNPDAPELPVLVYDGLRFVCEAECLSKVGNKEQAAQHYIEKAKFLKPHKAAVKAIKQAVPLGLPAPAASQTIQSIVIEKPSTPAIQPELPKLKELSPGLFYDPATGQTIGNIKHIKQKNQLNDDDIEKYKRISEEREAKRLKRFGTP